jgi:thiamine-phosphate diphosphorylase
MAISLPQPLLCLVTDRTLGDQATMVDRIAAAVAGGVDMVQVREKDLPGGLLLELAQEIRRAAGDGPLLMVNERADVALAAGAAGVQLGEEGLPVSIAREILGPRQLVGRSVHSVEGAVEAASQGADLLVVGTMFATRSHPGAAAIGPVLLNQISQRCNTPMIGIGGINTANLGEVLKAGACGVAVISSILAADDPEEAARELKQAMFAEWTESSAFAHGQP